MEEFFEEEAGEALGMVADDAVFFQEIVEDDAEAEFLEGGNVDGHGFGALRTITAGHIGRHRLAVGDDPIDDPARNVLLDGAQMIGQGVTGGFAGLRHQIGDIDARSGGFGNGSGNFRNQQVWKNAGVERAGAEKYQVSLLDGFDGLGKRAHTARGKLKLFDWHFAGGDLGFALKGAAVFVRGNEVHVWKGGRKNAAANGEHFAADADSLGEIAGDARKRGGGE